MARRSFVTGANGFLGAHLVRALLDRGDSVHIFIRPISNLFRLGDISSEIVIHEGSILSKDSLERALHDALPEHVFHLAGYGASGSEQDSALIQDVNVTGTRLLYEACANISGIQAIVHAGSAVEYGKKTVPLDEQMMASPRNEYGLAKLWATLYGEMLREEKHMPITSLRLFNTYGPYDVPTRFTAALTLALLRSQMPKLSGPEVVRDFVYVDDVVSAFLLASEGPCGIYNIGSGTQTSLYDSAAIIQKALGTNVNLEWGGDVGRNIDSECFKANTQRAKDLLGWEPHTTFVDGIEETVKWFTKYESYYA